MNSHKHSPGSIISNVSKVNSEVLNEDAGNDSGNNAKKMIEWSFDNEEILAEWCDIAQCYKWLNHHAHDYYSALHAWFTIPAITFSTISGTASFASASIPVEFQSYAPMAIGTINILIGILTTIQQYLKVSELKESYRLAAISWDKYARNICIELSKSPIERIDAGTFLKFSRQEYDRLMESNQSIPPHIIQKFRRNFRGRTAEEKKRFDLIKKPDICDVIVSINEKRHMWFPNRHHEEPTETDSIDTTSTFREYMIFKQNTIKNRNIPYHVDNIPEPETNNRHSYTRKFSKENLLKHDHIYGSDIENHSTTYSENNEKPIGYKSSEYNRRKNSENENNMTAPRRTSKDQTKSTPAPRLTSKDYAMNMKDNIFKKLFNQSSNNEPVVTSDKSSTTFGRDKKIFERNMNESEKTVSASRSKTSHNKNKHDIESGFVTKTSNPTIISSMRKSSSMSKMYEPRDNISETSDNSLGEPYDDLSLSNDGDKYHQRTRSDSRASENNYHSKNKIKHTKDSLPRTENPTTFIPFNSSSVENKEKDSNNSSNSSLLLKNPNKPVKRVTHESDSKFLEENITISFQEDENEPAPASP